MAYLRELPKLMCDSCRKSATVELKTWRNEHYGNYCLACGTRILKAVQNDEKQLT